MDIDEKAGLSLAKHLRDNGWKVSGTVQSLTDNKVAHGEVRQPPLRRHLMTY